MNNKNLYNNKNIKTSTTGLKKSTTGLKKSKLKSKLKSKSKKINIKNFIDRLNLSEDKNIFN